VLTDQGERIGQQIERHRETAARLAHHRLVTFERIAVFVEDGHMDWSG
jgi:hypothetical protein